VSKQQDLKDKIMNAAGWSSITEILAKLIIPITNMILARIISPEAFGVVATVTMVKSFADIFTDAGFQNYLIQHEFKNEDEKYKNSNVAFWTNLSLSFLLWIIIVIFRDKIAMVVGNPGLGKVIAIACVQLILTSFSSIQIALYRRDFDFKTLFVVRMATICVPFLITIPLALYGLGYWSIIIGSIISQITNALILTIKSKWKPQLFFNITMLKEMLSFSVWSLIEAISIWFTAWIDVFFIGKYLNQYYLGIYKISTTMVNTLMSLVTAAILPILFSSLSRIHDDEKFNNMYYETHRLVSILIFPLGIGLYLYSDLATKILLGNGWEEASTVIGVWALTNSIKVVFCNLCSEVYRAKGRPKLSFLAQVLHLVVLVPACIISGKYGFWVLVNVRAWIRMEFVLVHLFIMKYSIGIPVRKIFNNVFPTGISAFAMGMLGFLLKQIRIGLLWDFLSIIICSIFYFSMLCLFKKTRKDIEAIKKRISLIFQKRKFHKFN
jgi:PST family polysaccharide transporter